MPGETAPPSKPAPHLNDREPADAQAHCAREAAALPLPDGPTPRLNERARADMEARRDREASASRPHNKSAPHLNERAQADADARRVREAAALRENLRRRKTQTRAREEAAPAPQATRPEIG